jgi:hypothetical protein
MDIVCIYVLIYTYAHTCLLTFTGYISLRSYSESLKVILIKFGIGKKRPPMWSSGY